MPTGRIIQKHWNKHLNVWRHQLLPTSSKPALRNETLECEDRSDDAIVHTPSLLVDNNSNNNNNNNTNDNNNDNDNTSTNTVT